MKYDSSRDKDIILRYRKSKQHPVSLAYKKEEWDEQIGPAIQKSGKPVASFIKEAVMEKLIRDGLL